MNSCLYCGKPVVNKYCNVSCQNKHLGSDRADRRWDKIMDFVVNCEHCKKDIIVREREKLHPIKQKYYCNRQCANSRKFSEETIEKKRIASEKLWKNKEYKDKIINALTIYKTVYRRCLYCNILFKTKENSKQKYCSNDCANKIICREGALKSVRLQNRRGKNEICFAILCDAYFNNVEFNKQLFDGWDADIIIHDLKIAVLWNGKWHYEKIKNGHSIEQVQNRDVSRILEIRKLGYKPYIIKDMGKHNKTFVQKQFDIFLNKINIEVL